MKITCAPPPEVKWFKNDQDVTKDSKFKIVSGQKDPNGCDSLIISSASRSSAGEFTVKAINEMGEASSRANVKVNSKLLWSNFLVFYICSFFKQNIVFLAKPSADDPDDIECFETDNQTIAIQCDGR